MEGSKRRLSSLAGALAIHFSSLPWLRDRSSKASAQEPFSTAHRMFWSRLVAAALVIYVLIDYPPTLFPRWIRDLAELLGLALLAFAAFGRVWCLIFVAGKKNEALVTDGPYSVVRNPLYLFSFVGVVGFGLAVENPLLASFLAVLFGVYYSGVVSKEERFLDSTFGAAFRDYCAGTRRWFPDLRRYREPPTVTVCPRKIRRGMLDAMWFIWVFLLWELIEAFHPSGLL